MRSDTSHSTSHQHSDSRGHRRIVIWPITWPIRRLDIVVARFSFGTSPNEHFTQS